MNKYIKILLNISMICIFNLALLILIKPSVALGAMTIRNNFSYKSVACNGGNQEQCNGQFISSSWPADIVAGDLMIIFFHATNRSYTYFTLVSGSGQSWTQLTASSGYTFGAGTAVFYKIATPQDLSGTKWVTATVGCYTASTACGWMGEFFGVSGVNSVDMFGPRGGAKTAVWGTNLTTPSITTDAANEKVLVLAWKTQRACGTCGLTMTGITRFTPLPADSGNYFIHGFSKDVASSGTAQQYTSTAMSDVEGETVIMTLKPYYCSASGGCGAAVDGGSCTTYSTSSVACGSSCTSRSSTCSNGSWSIAPYSNAGCSVNSCNCTGTPWGTVATGYSNTAYSTSSVACGSSCTGQTRTCTNTVMSGTYTNTSCSVNACASCTGTPWGTVAHGYSNTAYSSASPTCGTACASETRTCTNGTMSGSYTNTSCTAKCCANGACPQTNYGGAVCTSYSSATVACGSLCSSIATASTCQSNGLWNTTPAANASCSVLPCGFTISGNVFIDTNSNGVKDGGETTGYNGATVNVAGSDVSTNSNGDYSRLTISAGTYSVTLTVPVGYVPTTLKTVLVTIGPDKVVNFGIRPGCSFPDSGDYTITANCNLGVVSGIIDGVDSGVGGSNTAILTINNGATLLIGAANNQTLVYGSIVNNGTIIIAKGVGTTLKKGPIWVVDADGDGYPAPNATTQSIQQTAQPAGYVRKNVSVSLGIDCDDSNASIHPGAGCP